MSVLKNVFYTVLDLVTLKKGVPRTINNQLVRFPAKWSRYYESNYEEENYSFLQQQVKKGMQVIDIGAHIGLFSVTASQLTGPEGKVICFEPTPGTYNTLTETLRLNKCTNVIPVQAAVSEKSGTTTFYISDIEACNSNSLVKNKEEKEISAYEVKLVSIDDVITNYSIKPSLIKIDAEGAELDVLKGGVQTFKSIKPILILGLHPDFIKMKGDSLEGIWDLLISCGYVVQQEGKTLTKEFFCGQTLLFDVHCI
jgi:FkbM family methyltransferase